MGSTRWARALLVLSLSVTGLGGCQRDERALDGELREGVVLDALDGRPIAGAIVRVSGVEGAGATAADGRFEAPAGRAVHAQAPGYLASHRPDPGPLVLWPAAPSAAAVEAHLARLEAARVVRDDPRDPALRLEARAFLRGESARLEGELGAVRAALDAPPATIRIWRRGLDGSTSSCEGRVDVIELEEYVKGVLPHEWIASWHDESLRAGSLTIRTYAWGWVRRGGKYDCADLDDTARSQVYRDSRVERASRAVDDTRGIAITSGGVLVSGEYSAENGDPTAFAVPDPLCAGREVFGHGRGMCQWGSQRWALDGRDHLWIAAHYFPDSITERGVPTLPDYDATLVRQSAPDAMIGGARAEVWVELENTGRRTWEIGTTRLGVMGDRASPFFDGESWLDPGRATPPDAPDYGSGVVGRFTFSILAPEVEVPTTIEERFQLVNDETIWFGPEVRIRVLVEPRGVSLPDSGGPTLDASSDAGRDHGLSAGCAVRPAVTIDPGAFALALLVVLLRRRATRRART